MFFQPQEFPLSRTRMGQIRRPIFPYLQTRSSSTLPSLCLRSSFAPRSEGAPTPKRPYDTPAEEPKKTTVTVVTVLQFHLGLLQIASQLLRGCLLLICWYVDMLIWCGPYKLINLSTDSDESSCNDHELMIKVWQVLSSIVWYCTGSWQGCLKSPQRGRQTIGRGVNPCTNGRKKRTPKGWHTVCYRLSVAPFRALFYRPHVRGLTPPPIIFQSFGLFETP